MKQLEINKMIINFLGWEIKYMSDVVIPSELYIPTNLYEIENGEYNFTYDISDIHTHFISFDWLVYLIRKIREIKDSSFELNMLQEKINNSWNNLDSKAILPLCTEFIKIYHEKN